MTNRGDGGMAMTWISVNKHTNEEKKHAFYLSKASVANNAVKREILNASLCVHGLNETGIIRDDMVRHGMLIR
jgi:hypothetical protein